MIKPWNGLWICTATEPHIVLTHTPIDPFNPDHPTACQAVQRARLLASRTGVASAFKRIIPPDLYYFEPHQPELCEFNPNTFVDITSVMETKAKAMETMQAQSYCTLLHRACLTARQPRPAHLRHGGGQVCRGAATHASLGGEKLMTQDELNRFSELGVATVYEASGREGLIDIPLIQLLPAAARPDLPAPSCAGRTTT